MTWERVAVLDSALDILNLKLQGQVRQYAEGLNDGHELRCLAYKGSTSHLSHSEPVSSSAKLGQHAAAGRLVPVCPRPTDLREAWAQCGRWCHARSILSSFHLPGHKGEELTRRQGR